MPLVDAAHAGASAFAQDDQTALEFLILEWFELVKNRKKHNRRKLREQYNESQENSPRDHPPVLRRLTYEHVEQLHHNRGHDQTDQQTLAFVPKPRAEPLVGKGIAVFEPETRVLDG